MDEVMGPGYVIEADDVPEWFPRAIEGITSQGNLCVGERDKWPA